MTRINRRKAMQLGVGGVLTGRLSNSLAQDIPWSTLTPAITIPTPAQVRWQDCEIGLIYHFDLPIASGNFAPNNTYRKRIEPAKYNPKQLDTDQWIEAAKAVGAKYAVFTATHFSGFMQWQSDLYPYGVKQSKWRDGKGDVVADFVASCRANGILPGIYFSTHRNIYWNVWGHYVDGGEGRGTEQQQKFNRVAERMTEELCSRYGELVQIWYDAGVKTPAEGGPDVLPIFEKHQPNSVFYHNRQRSDHRWVGNEDGFANDPCWARMPGGDEVSHNSEKWKRVLNCGDANGSVWSPAMVDVPFRGHNVHNWFWAPGQDENVYPLDELVEMYYQSVGRNCNLVLGEVVSPDGLVPETDIARLREFGQELKRRFDKPIASTDGPGEMLTCVLPQACTITHIEICEDIRRGERVQAYICEGLHSNGNWRPLCEGTCIGHKHLHRLSVDDVKQVRLRVTACVARPIVKRLAVYG